MHDSICNHERCNSTVSHRACRQALIEERALWKRHCAAARTAPVRNSVALTDRDDDDQRVHMPFPTDLKVPIRCGPSAAAACHFDI